MLGRIRLSSSLDYLERPSSKILKDHCLSIYETTLMKLKLGSQGDPSPSIKEDALEDGEADSNSSSTCTEAMNTEACYSPASFPKDSHQLANSTTSTPEASEDCQSTEYSTDCRMKNSIIYLFSKFKNSPGIPTITEEVITTEDICCVAMSLSSSSAQSTDNCELLSEEASIDYSAALSEKVLKLRF